MAARHPKVTDVNTPKSPLIDDDDDPCGCDEPPAGVHVTTEEVEAYFIVRSLLRQVVPCQRVALQKSEGRPTVLLDGDPDKPICTLEFGPQGLAVVLHEAPDASMDLVSVNDLYDLAPRLRAVASTLEREYPMRGRVPEREVLA